MNPTDHLPDSRLEELTVQIQSGDQKALGPVFEVYRQRLQAAIRMRVNSRIRQREDESDILQEAFFSAAKDLPRYSKEPKVPVYVWLRGIVQQRLVDIHRKHLSSQKRTLEREVSINRPQFPVSDSCSIAGQIADDLTSPSLLASKAELRAIVQTVLEQLEPLDREIISLRHIEGLKSSDVAAVLQINQSTASTRYLRALKKLKDGLSVVLKSENDDSNALF